MKLHYTPPHLIDIIRRHLPTKYDNILEPSCGEGALLNAIKPERLSSVTAIDIDPIPLSEVKEAFLGIDAISTCFLEWKTSDRFDLILMNPPFSGKKSNWVTFKSKKMPIEIAFILKAINLCSEDGCIIAILPKSIISGQSEISLNSRKQLFEKLNLKYVYELNKFDFPKIEGQFYLLVAKKNHYQSKIKIRNSYKNEVVKTKSELKNDGLRLDYSFISSKMNIEFLLANPDLNFTQLKHRADIFRGEVTSPFNKSVVLHTTSYKQHWNAGSSTIFNTHRNKIYTESGDILVKRVSRNCIRTVGINLIKRKQIPTDCVIVIRPKSQNDSYKILFSLRTIYSNELGESILQNGTGAQYLTLKDLRETEIPINLDSLYPQEFIKYVAAARKNKLIEMKRIETKIFMKLNQYNKIDRNCIFSEFNA